MSAGPGRVDRMVDAASRAKDRADRTQPRRRQMPIRAGPRTATAGALYRRHFPAAPVLFLVLHQSGRAAILGDLRARRAAHSERTAGRAAGCETAAALRGHS